MKDALKIRQLEARNEHLELTVSDLRKQIEMILKREVTVCVMKKISDEEAREGFDYPSDLKNIFVWDGRLYLIVPKNPKRTETIKTLPDPSSSSDK